MQINTQINPVHKHTFFFSPEVFIEKDETYN